MVLRMYIANRTSHFQHGFTVIQACNKKMSSIGIIPKMKSYQVKLTQW